MSEETFESLVAIATRNALIIRWYEDQSEETRLNIRMFYAGELGCPLCEITDHLINQEDLDFIWQYFEEQIRRFAKA